MNPRILVADDDEDIARFVELHLTLEGFSVEVVHDGGQALDRATAGRPDLVLLDVMMPVYDGLEVIRRLRAQASTTALPVIMLSARTLSSDRVIGLTAGADDYIVKPFDTLELVARVRTTLRRTAEMRSLSPLTGFPGNHRIDLELASRAASGAPYAICHVDLDEFKSFNDAYGFLRGDDLLLALAGVLHDAAAEAGEPPVFVGHVGGDDFVLVCTPGQAEPLGERVVAGLDAVVPGHYDPADVARGWLEVPDRRGQLRRHPLVSVSIGVAKEPGQSRDHRVVVAAASEMKRVAKRRRGSMVAVDRRS
ncbi:MAG: Diguanylate cyclase response regulator [Frankiales bacterium]|nr:Diguanylate cyclase response regulator [Frankiales bacterium]